MDSNDVLKSLGSVAYWAAVAGIALAITKFAGPRDDIAVLTYALIAVGAIMIKWIMKAHSDQKNKDALAKENNTFVLSMMWSIMRRSLVNDHDKYCYEYKDINDTQRMVWMSDYDSYELLCEKLNKHNGVMDSYRDDILELPNHTEDHKNY